MKKSAILIGVLLSAGCVGEETIVETEDVAAEESSSITNEEEYIKSAIDYVNENLLVVEESESELQSLNLVGDEEWHMNLGSIVVGFYPQDTPYFLAETSLSSEQREKYDSTIEQYKKSSALITEISDGINSANKTYDKRKLEEIKQQLPVLKDELLSMKDQLEFERYK